MMPSVRAGCRVLGFVALLLGIFKLARAPQRVAYEEEGEKKKKAEVYDTRRKSVYGNNPNHPGVDAASDAAVNEEDDIVGDIPLYGKVECLRAGLSEVGYTMRSQKRSVVIKNQRLEPICAGRENLMDILGTCLWGLTALKVYAENADGSCRECTLGTEVPCTQPYRQGPPAMVLVYGHSDKVTMRCAGSYCGKTHTAKPVVISRADVVPSDYSAVCVADDMVVNGAQRRSVFEVPEAAIPVKYRSVTTPPTKFVWIPAADPHDRHRVLWERSRLYAAANLSAPTELKDLWTRVARLPPRGGGSNFDYAARTVDPIFFNGSSSAAVEPITVLPEDSIPLAIVPSALLAGGGSRSPPPKGGPGGVVGVEEQPVVRNLVYLGDISEANGQVDFLKKIPTSALKTRRVKIVLLGSVAEPALGGPLSQLLGRFGRDVVEHVPEPSEARVREVLQAAAGLIDMSARSRNESRHVYEALALGLPVLASFETMPYVGLQCRSFFVPAPRDAVRHDLHRGLMALVAYINRTPEPRAAIQSYLRRELAPNEVYKALCERLGFCRPRCAQRAEAPWAKGSCKHADLKRYENWAVDSWPASPGVATKLGAAECGRSLQSPASEWWPRRTVPSRDEDDCFTVDTASASEEDFTAEETVSGSPDRPNPPVR